jgi:hypothetical protein
MTFFENSVKLMVKIGILDVILPFILAFTLIFAFLQKTNVFGKEDGEPKIRINITIALVVALLFVNFVRVVGFISWFLYFAIFIVAVFCILLITALIGIKSKLTNTIIILVFIAIIGIVTQNYIDYSILWKFLIHPATLVIIAAGAIAYYIVKEPKPKKKPKKEKEKEEEEQEPSTERPPEIPPAIERRMPGTSTELPSEEESELGREDFEQL